MNALQAYAEHRPVTAELTRAIPVPKQGNTPDQPWPARAAFTDDATQMHPIIDATTVQPIASTRMQPQQIRPQQPRPPQARGNQPGMPLAVRHSRDTLNKCRHRMRRNRMGRSRAASQPTIASSPHRVAGLSSNRAQPTPIWLPGSGPSNHPSATRSRGSR
ncbi:hypothetical protein [Ornithinimicrobium sp. INDO-MA30-4]|uniref:hypothetical protein n=1 Tax=Ornithinimicrobium sp. INDO-MA30-4 TaxID=2908651 RepID=UPI001F1B5900|nr:hypothetical protein [Ornithinimicrobium sp. INDO-MA30-4]UJH69609.1 hypothetical protein L0A91_09610 [Ornithinimicrobium sp. INDO-MA30-4]